ncbi:glycerol kinase GlpK [Acrocarpospora macrocephala]|uniref:ATP:glycerol 3-phosphotransferase n=1 Tax=Acrocarpospora macrocephala TaxID=150177 RepID=A0A5M3WXS4_9ACTN|nr:FGGY family carbohydrate kinase [Acrocarpospora macrocephala]GES11333.1 glycerol kinase [Acrocarpospora macrocephala]
MSIRVYAGVDQGTTSTFTGLYDEEGRCVASARRRSATSHPRPGWDEQDGLALLAAIEDTVAEALARVEGGAELAGIGLANQGESVIAFDRRTGEPLSPAILWSDRRATEVVEPMAGTPQQDELEERTGLPLDPYFSAGKIAWMLRNLPGVQEAAGHLAVGTLDSFFIYHLTGGEFITDPSTGSRTQLMDLDTLEFDEGCAGAYGIDIRTLPRIVDTIVSEPISTRLGAPLYASSCDQQAALAAVGGISAGDVKVTYGTGCFIEANAGPKPRRPGNGLMPTFAWSMGQTRAWAIEGGVFTAATAVDWLVSLGLAPDAAAVSALAAGGDPGTMFLPSFSGIGAPWWRPGAAGVLSGLRASTTPADIARAVLEGVANRVADVIDAVEREQDPPEALRVDGGLSASATLLQLQADLCGRAVLPAVNRDSTAAGVAGFAAMGAGELDLPGLAARAAFHPPVAPRRDAAWREEHRARWRRFVAATRGIDPSELEVSR